MPIELLELIHGKKVMVGAIDVATNNIETPEEVAATLRAALEYVNLEKSHYYKICQLKLTCLNYNKFTP